MGFHVELPQLNWTAFEDEMRSLNSNAEDLYVRCSSPEETKLAAHTLCEHFGLDPKDSNLMSNNMYSEYPHVYIPMSITPKCVEAARNPSKHIAFDELMIISGESKMDDITEDALALL